jgi:hypothetical protein
VAGAIGRGLGRGVVVGLAVGLGVGSGDGVAGSALLATTVGLGVAVLEQATTASSSHKIEPIRARRPVRTLSSQVIYITVAPLTPRPPLLLCGRQAPFQGEFMLSCGFPTDPEALTRKKRAGGRKPLEA